MLGTNGCRCDDRKVRCGVRCDGRKVRCSGTVLVRLQARRSDGSIVQWCGAMVGIGAMEIWYKATFGPVHVQ